MTLGSLQAEVERLATVVTDAPMDVPVPSCPDWSLRELVRHIGEVHRWAARNVQECSQVRIRPQDVDFDYPDLDDGYPDWLRSGGAILADTFAAADLDAPMWAWGLDQHARFWPRRMLHETTIHRVDAELALGIEPVVDPAVAVDGIDELLENLPRAEYFRPEVANLKGEGETVVLAADEGDASWTITLGADGFAWSRGGGGPDAPTVAVHAPVSDLLLLIYSRRRADESRVSVQGARDVLDRWLVNSSL